MTAPGPHILILCPSMWPEMRSWGETQRMYYLSNFLSDHGWRVSTISPGFENASGIEDRAKKYTPHFFGSCLNPEDCVKRLPGQTGENRPGGWTRRIVSATLTPFVKWFYNEPDCYEGLSKGLWIRRYRNRILQWIAENRVDIVLISAPAFALFRIGKLVKKNFPFLPIIFDYRDPWHLWNLHRDFAYRKERNYLKYADGIVGFSRAFTEEMIAAFRLPEETCTTIYNGYSEADWTAFEAGADVVPAFLREKQPLKLRLTFTGNISLDDSPGNFRNPAELIRTIRRFPEIECYFIGVQGPEAGTAEGNIHYIGKVSQAESFACMKNSDVLLSIHLDGADCSGKYLISGKFFDYIRSGRVIWHIGSPDSLMSRWIADYGLGVFCENEPNALCSMLENLTASWRQGNLSSLRNCSPNSISGFSREYQNTRYLDFIHFIKEHTNEEEKENG